MCEMFGQFIQKKKEKRIEEEQVANARYWKIPTCCDDDDDYNSAITPYEPIDSLSMGDEHLNTISATESDEFIKSCVENLVLNLSESEGKNGCDVPACFTTFSNVLFDAEYEFDSSDDQSCSDEDVLEKIFSNPLFDEEIISMKIDPHHFNDESDLTESLLNHDSSMIPSSSKIDSLLDEFAGELTLLKLILPGVDETDCDPEEDIRLIKRLLALYTTEYCCSDGSLGDKIICDLDKTSDLSQRPSQNCPKCGNPVDDSSEPSNEYTNVVNALQEPFDVNQDPDKNSSQSPPQINHHCCYGCGDLLEDIFCHQCTCELCGKGAYYGYNCPSKVPITPDPEPFNNQTVDEFPQTVPSFDPICYSEDQNSFTYDSTSNLVDDSPNVFNPSLQLPLYFCEFCGNDARYGHYCTPQVSFIYPEPCYNQDFNFLQDFHDFQQQYLCCKNCGVTHEAYQCQPMNEDYYHEQNSCYDPNSFGFDQFQPPQYTVNYPIFNAQNDLFNSQNKLMEQLTSMCDMIPVCYNDDNDDDYTIAITPKEPNNSLSMGDEHLDTISATKSDEFIKSSVENLVPNPSESEGEYECDVPTCENFTTFSNILFDFDYDFSSSEGQTFYDEDIPKEIYSNPLFDEEIISMKIDLHHFNAESDLIESLLNHDSSIISSSSKIDSLFDEFAGELTLLKSIPLGINKTDCDPEEEIRLIKRLLYDNSSPRPPKEFISENSDAAFESFSLFPIPVEDSDSLMEKIDLSFTPDDPMQPGIEEDDYDSKRDILILEELLSNDSLSLFENESFYFDIPSSSRPLTKPPDGNSGILNVKVMGNISKHKVLMPRLMM
nr:hypothetical protein [Tanacetum cinerariifolium]